MLGILVSGDSLSLFIWAPGGNSSQSHDDRADKRWATPGAYLIIWTTKLVSSTTAEGGRQEHQGIPSFPEDLHLKTEPAQASGRTSFR
jgi:hypothetical protein